MSREQLRGSNLASIRICIVSDLTLTSACKLSEFALNDPDFGPVEEYNEANLEVNSESANLHGNSKSFDDSVSESYPRGVELILACGPFTHVDDVDHDYGSADEEVSSSSSAGMGGSENFQGLDWSNSREHIASAEGVITCILSQLENIVCRVVYFPSVMYDPPTLHKHAAAPIDNDHLQYPQHNQHLNPELQHVCISTSQLCITKATATSSQTPTEPKFNFANNNLPIFLQARNRRISTSQNYERRLTPNSRNIYNMHLPILPGLFVYGWDPNESFKDCACFGKDCANTQEQSSHSTSKPNDQLPSCQLANDLKLDQSRTSQPQNLVMTLHGKEFHKLTSICFNQEDLSSVPFFVLGGEGGRPKVNGFDASHPNAVSPVLIYPGSLRKRGDFTLVDIDLVSVPSPQEIQDTAHSDSAKWVVRQIRQGSIPS